MKLQTKIQGSIKHLEKLKAKMLKQIDSGCSPQTKEHLLKSIQTIENQLQILKEASCIN